MSSSELLAGRIRERINRSGIQGWYVDSRGTRREQVPCLSFHDYMAMCLYDNESGYYRTGAVRIGKSGDFYTSSGIGSVMGEKLAAYIASLMERYDGCGDLAEWGAGTGRLSQQILAAWRQRGISWKNMTFTLVDGNPVHLEEAMRTLHPEAIANDIVQLRYMNPQEAEACNWRGKPLILYANELLDAFPVHRVVMKAGRLWELGVSWVAEDHKAGFRYVQMPLSTDRIVHSLQEDGIVLKEGQELDVNLAAEKWIADMGSMIDGGAIILIDYGHTAEELAASHRMRGTLMCYRNHIAHDDPFVSVGEQDITAHVNFTACERAAAVAGWKVRYYGTQKQFLIDQGVLEDLMDHDGRNPFSEIARRNRAIRQLLLGGEMSETFKVMVLVR
ncbi:SAM-dependent methyltransferase [Paenibacillus oenotherae]|uniref:SAM-dependent methyltransferase n=1 Tax=Paenibacillus oenotherae TaxID=1435645 RepID=A0ABS7D259_9BACL|nr:SAM-dependent methyltransferase [Paenibacillus oenotherae]MBW7473667.1 SAM-dependent methyltransferase [Paenibacillus oenotherae]